MHHPTSSKEHQLRTSKVRRAKDGRARTRGQKNQTAMMMTGRLTLTSALRGCAGEPLGRTGHCVPKQVYGRIQYQFVV